MKKINIILLVLLLFSCANNNKQKTDTALRKNEISLKIDSAAIIKNNEAAEIYSIANGNPDSLNKAIVLLDKALKISPKYLLAYENKIHYLTIMGKYKEAISVIDEALKVSPDNPFFIFPKGILYEKAGMKELAEKNYKESILCFDKSISLSPDDFNLLVNRSFTKIFIKDKEVAINDFKALKKRYDKNSKEYKQLDYLIKLVSEINKEEYVKKFWCR